MKSKIFKKIDKFIKYKASKSELSAFYNDNKPAMCSNYPICSYCPYEYGGYCGIGLLSSYLDEKEKPDRYNIIYKLIRERLYKTYKEIDL